VGSVAFGAGICARAGDAASAAAIRVVVVNFFIAISYHSVVCFRDTERLCICFENENGGIRFHWRDLKHL
jgi:hypothetical protein